MTMSSKAKEITDIFDWINARPDLEEMIFVEEESGRRFLCNHEETTDQEFVEKIKLLESKIHDYCISDQGQHSEVYYELQKTEGYSTRIFEQDSFGPLCVGIRSIKNNWWITYG